METCKMYTEVNELLKFVTLFLSEEHSIKLTPMTRVLIVEGKEVLESYLEFKIIDDTVSYEETFDFKRKDLNDLIKVLNELMYQMKSK